jgi:hypothetical protein
MVYAWCLKYIDPAKVDQWLVDLESPLPGRPKAPPTERQIELEGADFMATMAMAQGRKAG